MSEVPLPGGFVNQVVRVGDTVHRPQSARAGYVHQVLELLELRGWVGAPRFLGVDEANREILTFMAGYVPWRSNQAQQLRSEENLAAIARLTRQFHDLTAGTSLAEDQEVVCHNDLSPKNTIYQDQDGGPRPVAFIDWDLAAPGARIADVAHVCWQYIGLEPNSIDAQLASQLMRYVSDEYQLSDRGQLIDTVLWWQDRCWRGIEAAAADGDPAMIHLRDSGASRSVRAAHDWVLQNRFQLGTAL